MFEKAMASKTHLVPTELPTLRTAFTKTYTIGPNRYTAFQSAIQIHARRGDAWQEVDARFRERNGALVSEGPALTVACAIPGEKDFLTVKDEKGRQLTLGLEGAQPVKPEIPEPEKIESEDPAEIAFLTAQANAQGTLLFRDIYPGVTLCCHTNGQLASTFAFASPEAAREIVLTLSLEKLRARVDRDQRIELTDGRGEVVFTVCPPAVFDAVGEEGLVRLSAEEKDGVLRAVYAPDPAFMVSAKYPVILDPVIQTQKISSSVESTWVSSDTPNTDYSTHMRLYATKSGSLTRNSFVRFTVLPALAANHYMTEARFVIYEYAPPSSNTAVYAREVQETWSAAQVRYGSQPSFNTDRVQDYVRLNKSDSYGRQVSFDVTGLARKWYQGTNYGVALTACEVTPSSGMFYSSHHTGNNIPHLQVFYSSLAGLEDYLTYDATSAGMAGTGQVSLANGNLIFLHADTAMNGARMPVSVTHVYNSCDSDTDPFGCGYGWRTNFHQTLQKEYLDDKVYYVYTDGDGTEHWFKPTTTAATKYKDESGLSMELVPSADGVTIRDKGDGVMTFPVISATPTAADPTTDKVLISSIADACGNTITVSGTGLKISQITDGAGRISVFEYDNESGMLTAIRTPWQPAPSDTPEVRFTYTDGCLTGIRYVDNRESAYVYQTATGTGCRLLTSAAGPEGITAAFSYANTNVLGGLPHVVTQAQASAGTGSEQLTASHTLYSYGAQLCLVTDQLTGKSLRYHFNENGNCTSVDDGLGYAVFAEYDQSGENANAPINHPTGASRVMRVVNNLLADGLQCKTTGIPWTKVGTGTVEQSIHGSGFGRYQKKFTVANGNTLYLRQTVSVEAGQTYTLSGYVQSLGAKACLRVTAGNETFQSTPVELLGAETETELERTQVTFVVPTGVTSVHCDLVAEGTARGTIAWWDSAQLEEGETANHVNLVENSRMNRTAASGLPDCWLPAPNCSNFLSYQARADCLEPMPEHLPGNILRVAGRFDRNINTYQSINVSGKKDDLFTVGGWASSYAKKTNGGNLVCQLAVYFASSNGSDWSGYQLGGVVDFNHEEGSWQFICGQVKAPRDFNWVRVAILYNRQMNYGDFSNLFLYKERFGTEFVYDERGNRKKRTSSAGNAGGSTYDDYNNVLTSKATGRTVATTYDWGSGETQLRKHLLQSATSPLGTYTTYQYDANGSPTQTKMQESTAATAKYIQTDTAYTPAGTYVATQTDARGKTVTTVTDPDKGTVTKVTGPAGQEVNSQYDALRRLTKTSTMLTATQEVKTENTYQAQTGYLASTTHTTDSSGGSVTYNFTYDTLGRQVSVAVGSNVLSTTYYDAIRRTVDHIAFCNGGAVQYLYDSFSRVIGIRYDGATSDRFTYGYDAQGRTAYVIDHTQGTTVYTDYDLAGRPCRKTQLSGTAHHYTGQLTYNDYELPHEFTEYVGPARAKHVTGFGYDDENRVTALTFTNGSVGYTYDALGRISQRTLNAGATPVGTTYTYVPGGHGTDSTTGMIQTIAQGGVTLTYQYDDRGNITSVSDDTKTTSYVYDAIGQLIRVNDPYDPTANTTEVANGTTWVFTYDLGGNILTKKAYAYTTENVSGLTPVQSHTYTYGNTAWKDQLTALDGVTITYDAIGNPLTDGTWTYTWQQGKQLALMQKTENGVTTTVSFEYNEDGLRTKKTVTVGQAETVTEYVLHGKNVVHLTRGTDELHFYYDAQGKPAVVVCNSVAYGYLYNLQGDVLALVDGTGSKVVEYRYDAWGKPISKTGTLASTLGTLQPFRYRGYVWDEETEDYYLRSRYYRPEWCRFVNADSVIEENTYTYCSNNAINAFDPDGYSEAYADLLRIGGAALLIVITVGTMMRPALVNTSISIGNITTKPNSLIIDAVTSATTVDAKDSSLNNYSVYWFQSEHMDLPYVGITMRPKTREREHQRRKNDPNIHLSIIATGLSKDKARVAETAIIAAYTKKGLENRIYSIAPWRFRKGRFRSEINDVWYSLQEAFRDLWEIENDR